LDPHTTFEPNTRFLPSRATDPQTTFVHHIALLPQTTLVPASIPCRVTSLLFES
jgi:hypothetical protein